MISKKIIISLLFVLIVIGNLFSQQSISGKIYNEKTKQAIPNVEVVLKPLNKGSVTNKEGKFFFENIESGNYTIIVSHIGFVKQKKAITIEKNQNMILDFNLISEIFQLDPIEIRQSRMTKIPYIQNEVLRAELDQAGIKDIGEYMRTIPNVSGVRKGGSAVDPVVRGFKFSQLNVSLDNGIKIVGGCPNRMDPTVSHVASEDIEKIEVIKGPHVLRYGPAFGGVVNLITYKPTAFKTKKFELHAKAMKAYDSNANGNRERLFLTGGNNKVYFSLSGNRKNYGNYKDGNGDEVLSKFLKYNYTAKLGVKIKENQELLFSFDDSHTRDCYFPALPMDERIDDTRVMSINYSAKMVSKRVMGIMASAYNTDVWHVMDNKERGISDTAVTISKVQTYTRGASVGTMLKVWNNSKLRIGTGFMNVDKVGDRFRTYLQDPINGQLPKTNETLMDGNVTNAGLLLELTKDIGTFNIVAAARFDVNMAKSEDTIKIIYNGIHYFDEIESTHKNLSASLAINKPVSEKFSIGLAMGRGVRSPNLLERYVKLLPVGYDNFDYLGNPQIKPEANHQIDLSCKYNSEKIGYLEAGIFYSYITDFITSKVLPPVIIMNSSLTGSKDVIGTKYYYNTDYATFTGFEIAYSTPLRYKFGAQMGASYTMATIGEATGYLADASGTPIAANVIKNDPAPEIPPFESNIMLYYNFFDKKLVTKALIRLVADQTYVSQSYNEHETPGFTVADLNITYKYNDKVTIAAGVKNIFIRAYYEHLNRRIIGADYNETIRSSNLYEPGRSFFINLLFNIF